jgi:hypothetical protein
MKVPGAVFIDSSSNQTEGGGVGEEDGAVEAPDEERRVGAEEEAAEVAGKGRGEAAVEGVSSPPTVLLEVLGAAAAVEEVGPFCCAWLVLL